MINILKDIDPIDYTDDFDVILVGTNIYGKLSNGWQLDMKIKYPDIHKANLQTKYADKSKLGKYITIKNPTTPDICLLYINEGYNFRPDLNNTFVSYEALEECLYKINIEYKGKKIMCPILGHSKFDGNGDKDRLIQIFETQCPDVNVTLYDYTQTGNLERKTERIKEIVEAKHKDKGVYLELVKKRKEYDNNLTKINFLKT